MNAKTTSPPDWKPAAFNPNFSADEEFEEQDYRLNHIGCVLNVFSDLSSTSGDGFQQRTVQFNREDLAGMFQFLRDAVYDTAKRNELMHKHISNKWGMERLLAERELRGEA